MQGYKKKPLAVRAHRQGALVENHHKDTCSISHFARCDKGVLL